MSFDQAERIKFGIPETVQQAEYKVMGIPENLNGRVVLELFSGDSEHSLRSLVLAAGGDYASVDLGTTQPGAHFVFDVYKINQLFDKGVADYIVMSHPPINNFFPSALERLFIPYPKRDSNLDEKAIIGLLTVCLPHLKPISGSLIAIGAMLTSADVDMIRKLTSHIPNFSRDYRLEVNQSPHRDTYDIRHTFSGPTFPKETAKSVRVVRK